MSVAICISGNLRILNLEFINGLIDILSNQGFIVDSFLSTWDDKGYWTKDDEKGLNLGEKLNEKDIEDIKKIKNLRVLDIEELNYNIQNKLKEEFEVLVKDVREKRLRFGRPHNIVGMYYKIWRCNNLKLDYEKNNKYDYTFRIRPDFIVDEISLNLNEELTIYKQPNELYLDTFFYGKSEYMDKISRMYLHLREIYKNTKCLFDPHDLLKHFVDSLKKSSNFKNEFKYINASVFNTKNGYCKE